MSLVTLVSGGLDSTVMAVLAKEEGLTQFPLFIDYGQINREKELKACLLNFKRHKLPNPMIARLAGYGALISSGITNLDKDIFKDAFLPCRNLMFLTVGAAYAFQRGASAVSIGLLNESYSIFPDQTKAFIGAAESTISVSLGRSLRILAPMISLSKAEVLGISKLMGINGTYSCHAGTDKPCGVCVACREYLNLEG